MLRALQSSTRLSRSVATTAQPVMARGGVGGVWGRWDRRRYCFFPWFPGIWVMSGQVTLSAFLRAPCLSAASHGDESQPALQEAEPAAAAGWGCLHLILSLPEWLLPHLPFHLFINHHGLLSKSGLSFRVLTGEWKSGLRERVVAFLASFFVCLFPFVKRLLYHLLSRLPRA